MRDVAHEDVPGAHNTPPAVIKAPRPPLPASAAKLETAKRIRHTPVYRTLVAYLQVTRRRENVGSACFGGPSLQ